MTSPTNLFRLINEVVLFLLGALLMLLAATRSLGPPRSPTMWALLGVLLVYWGARAGMRHVPPSARWHERLRAGSFVVAGLVILNVAWLPFRDAPLALFIAGAVMALRGLLSAAVFVRASLVAKSSPAGH
jgi:hypothetical protein